MPSIKELLDRPPGSIIACLLTMPSGAEGSSFNPWAAGRHGAPAPLHRISGHAVPAGFPGGERPHRPRRSSVAPHGLPIGGGYVFPWVIDMAGTLERRSRRSIVDPRITPAHGAYKSVYCTIAGDWHGTALPTHPRATVDLPVVAGAQGLQDRQAKEPANHCGSRVVRIGAGRDGFDEPLRAAALTL